MDRSSRDLRSTADAAEGTDSLLPRERRLRDVMFAIAERQERDELNTRAHWGELKAAAFAAKAEYEEGAANEG